MRKSRFSDEQMVAILREADRTTVAAAAKKHKVSEQTIYAWRKHFGELEPTDVKAPEGSGGREREAQEAGGRARSRDRGDEGDHRKKMVSAQARREQCAYACERGLSERRACGLIGWRARPWPTSCGKPAKDAPVIDAMKRLSAQYPRYGYRRIRIFLGREGIGMSASRAIGLWRKAGLQVPRKRPRRRIAGCGPGRCRHGPPTRSGPTTSCSTPAPTASSSSA